MSSEPRQVVFLFDMSRHRSHLVFRYMGTHPGIQDLWHPFLPASLFGPERMTQHTKNPNQDGHEWTPPSGTDTYAEATSKFLNAARSLGDQSQILVTNEHTQMVLKQDISLALLRAEIPTIPTSVINPTVIPDQIFAKLTPIFVIRNPIYAVPSNYNMFGHTQLRPGGEDWRMVTGVPLQRSLFDHFRNSDSRKKPLVIDGDDVVWRTEELRDKLARALNLAPEGFSSVWEPMPDKDRVQHPVLRPFLQTIDDSTGIEGRHEQRPDADLDRAYGGWLGEHGQEVADQLRATIEVNMPHYEYMAQFKM